MNAADKFGIIDPEDKNGKRPAEISYDKAEKEKWNAVVESNNRDDYKFIAVDNNIPLSHVNSSGIEETNKRCDAMLYTKKSVCFIELKIAREAWLQPAIEQLESTIQDFGDEINKYDYKKAYVCNKNRPQSSYLFTNIQSQFYKKHKIVLRTKIEIDELK